MLIVCCENAPNVYLQLASDCTRRAHKEAAQYRVINEFVLCTSGYYLNGQDVKLVDLTL